MQLSVERPLRQYEAVIILHPDVNETEAKSFFRRNQETIQKYNGRVNHIDSWGKRRIANPIEKVKLGHYFHTTFESKGEAVAELERLMRIDERVLRYLHVRLDERKPLAQHLEQYKNSLAESLRREQEREAKAQARRMHGGGGGGAPGGGRRREQEEEEEIAE